MNCTLNNNYLDLYKNKAIKLHIYLKKEDKKTHDVLLCLQSHSLISDPNRWRFPGNTYYIMQKGELLSYFKKEYSYKKIKKENKKKNAVSPFKYEYVHDYDGDKFTNPEKSINGFVEVVDEGHFSYADLNQDIIEEAIAETEHVAQLCTFEIELGKHYLPKIPIPIDEPQFKHWEEKKKNKGKINEDYLRFLCIKGLKKLGLTEKKYRERLDYELGIINGMDFPDYFLIYYDIAKFCHDENIPFGPGRGCFVADSIVEESDKSVYIPNVKIGDKVLCHDELYHDVVAKHEYDIDEDIVSLQYGDNQIHGVTKDHKIYAIKQEDYDKGVRTPQWYSANDLNIGDYICEL